MKPSPSLQHAFGVLVGAGFMLARTGFQRLPPVGADAHIGPQPSVCMAVRRTACPRRLRGKAPLEGSCQPKAD